MEQLNNNEYNILVVEDDKEIREGIEIFLKSQGYHVYKAADGVEGLEVIERENIHLAIVDIMMPRMDGVTMTIKLREHHEFPVIMLSAKSEETDKVIGLNIGADDYVTKPFTPLELMARVNSQLRRRNLKIDARMGRKALVSNWLNVLNWGISSINGMVVAVVCYLIGYFVKKNQR